MEVGNGEKWELARQGAGRRGGLRQCVQQYYIKHLKLSMGILPRMGMMSWRTASIPKITLLGTLAEPGPLWSTLPSTSIMLGIIPPAMILRLSVKKPKGGSSPKSRSFTGVTHPTARPAMESNTTAHHN